MEIIPKLKIAFFHIVS